MAKGISFQEKNPEEDFGNSLKVFVELQKTSLNIA